MAQNIYDDEAFFAAYAALPRSQTGLTAAPEWPDLRQMLPPLGGSRVLDLGCGYGWFARYAAESGAAHVVGLDISERMLDVARATSVDAMADGTISYRRVDLDHFDATSIDVSTPGDRDRFDLVFSSLTFHYVVDFDRLMRALGEVVAPAATIVCSVEHPVATAPTSPAGSAPIRAADGRSVWPLDGYFSPGERLTDWLTPGVLKQHRTIESYLRGLRQGGFGLTELVEWHPTPAHLAEHPDWAEFNEHPSFLLLRGDRSR